MKNVLYFRLSEGRAIYY